MSEKIKVLIVDSSAIFRQTLTKALLSDAAIEVIGTASDPFIAANKMATQVPDVITMDVEMNRMNGMTFLKKIMSQHPIPVIIISDLFQNNMELTLKAMEYGAAEVMTKKMFEEGDASEESLVKFRESIKKAAHSKPAKKALFEPAPVQPKFTADAVLGQVVPKI